METIIRFTDAAAEHIKNMLEKKSNSIGFRLSIKKTGCSGYAYVPKIIDTIIETDIHFNTPENLSVYIDPDGEKFIKGLVIDYVDDELGLGVKQKRLVFINPNEKNRCGCGESFTIE
jgi:iron-sulfur cluster assembly accessory protein